MYANVLANVQGLSEGTPLVTMSQLQAVTAVTASDAGATVSDAGATASDAGATATHDTNGQQVSVDGNSVNTTAAHDTNGQAVSADGNSVNTTKN